jgi:hypothetical protein
MVKAQKPRRELGMSPYPIFHKAKNTLAEHMDVVPTIQTVKNLEVEIQDRENVTANTSWAHPAIQDIETDYTRSWEAYINSDDDELILPQAPHSASTPELAPSSSDSLFDGMDLFTDPPSCKGNCGLASPRVETSKSGRGSEVSLLINRHRY